MCKHMKRSEAANRSFLSLNWVKHSSSLWVSLSQNLEKYLYIIRINVTVANSFIGNFYFFIVTAVFQILCVCSIKYLIVCTRKNCFTQFNCSIQLSNSHIINTSSFYKQPSCWEPSVKNGLKFKQLAKQPQTLKTLMQKILSNPE